MPSFQEESAMLEEGGRKKSCVVLRGLACFCTADCHDALCLALRHICVTCPGSSSCHYNASDAQNHIALLMHFSCLAVATAQSHGITVCHFSVPSKLYISFPGCHQPPVLDQELVARIKAFNDGDIENSIHAWLCRRCSNKNSSRSVKHTNIHPPDVLPQSIATTTSMPSLCVKYNLAPSWMHNRHSDMGKTPTLPKKRTSRKFSAKNNLTRDSFNFSSISWLEERRGSYHNKVDHQ
jgi:hypothetical protein